MKCPYCKNKLEKEGFNHCPSCGGALTRTAELKKDVKFCPSVRVFSLLCFISGIIALASMNYTFAIASLVMYSLYNKTTLVYNPRVKIGRILSIVSIVVSAVILTVVTIAGIILTNRFIG